MLYPHILCLTGWGMVVGGTVETAIWSVGGENGKKWGARGRKAYRMDGVDSGVAPAFAHELPKGVQRCI